MNTLEDYLAGKPLSPRLERLMRGEDEEPADDQRPTTSDRSYADGTPVTDADREHLRRTVSTAGWQVLLKLLDTSLQSQEDAARRMSKDAATPNEQIVTAWRDLAGASKARNGLLALVESEVGKLKPVGFRAINKVLG
jgi:hypothetical protein